MRVLISGGSGAVGGRLAQFLADQGGYDVTLGTRKPETFPRWAGCPSIVRTAWRSPVELGGVCAGMDAVVHLAGMNAQDCVADPVGALEVNGVHTARLVHAARSEGVRRFIYVSTAHVYGAPLRGTITEATCPVSLHAYATSHRAGEDAVRAEHERGGIEGLVVRLSNSYGAPAHKEANCWMLLMNDLCRQAATTGRMTLHSSGLQRRDFVPLHDVCRSLEHLLRLPVERIGRALFNVGGQWSPTIWEAAGLVQRRCAEVLGFEPPLSRVPPRTDEVPEEFEYRIDSLLSTGFLPDADQAAEIDRLLSFCKASFAST